jgi:pullulanase
MKKMLGVGLVMLLFALGCTSTGAGGETVEPGTIEREGNPLLPLILKALAQLQPANDEVVLFYYRNDEKYEPYGFWLWRFGDGDGAKNWDITKNIREIEVDGKKIGYLRFKLDGSNMGEQPIVNPAGEFGFIRRPDSGWEGQTPDFVWNTKLKGRFVVYFEGAKEPEPAVDYKPQIKSAAAVERPDEVVIELSGRHALGLEPSSMGFEIVPFEGQGPTVRVVDALPAANRNNRRANYTNKVILKLETDLPAGIPLMVRHPEYFAPQRIDTSALVSILADRTIPPRDLELGAIYNSATKSVTFRMWSPFASSVKARLWTRSVVATGPNTPPDFVVDLVKDQATGVWSGSFNQRDPDGLFYDYLVSTSEGTKPALDPYAKSMDAYINEGGVGRGAIVDLAKSEPQGGWQGFEDYKLEQRVDAVIYEIHVRDLTIAPDSGVTPNLKGTYLGFIEKLDFLKSLGITHIQLLPVHNFYYTDETNRRYEDAGTTSNNNYNWGYDPHSYFAPEGWYATNPIDPYLRIRELKTLIREIHKRGMGVIIDVVYNHIGNTQVLENLVPGYYLRRNPNGTFTSMSGVGNDIASNRAMARRLIQDSLVYWAKEYKVDGFRFDLMGLIDADTILGAYQETVKIPGKEDILYQGEGWKMFRKEVDSAVVPLDQNFMTKTDVVSVFNDEIRNLLKGGGFNDTRKAWLTGGRASVSEIISNLMGFPVKNYQADQPGDSMLYVSAHDNMTLADNIAHNTPLNNATPEGRSEIAARAKLANMLILTGQGIAFLHAGCERGRSKPNVGMKNRSEVHGAFVHNSYDSSDNINQFPWTLPPEYQAMDRWVRGLIALRQANRAFRLGSADLVRQSVRPINQEAPTSLAYSITHEGRTWYILANASKDEAVFNLGTELSTAQVLVDRSNSGVNPIANPDGVNLSGTTVRLAGLTGAVIRK